MMQISSMQMAIDSATRVSQMFNNDFMIYQHALSNQADYAMNLADSTFSDLTNQAFQINESIFDAMYESAMRMENAMRSSMESGAKAATQLLENFSRLSFLNFAISKYPVFEEETVQEYSSIILDVAKDTCDIYEELEDDDIEVDSDLLYEMENQTKQFEKAIIASKLDPASDWLARNIGRIYFMADSLPHECRMYFYNWIAELPYRLIGLVADHFIGIILSITIAYLACDNKHLREFIDKNKTE